MPLPEPETLAVRGGASLDDLCEGQWSGQAPSYKPGERTWLQARQEAKERAGDASLKDFHSMALSLGSMGLDPLREALARF
jgi:uncharacterized protein (DUF885 family)